MVLEAFSQPGLMWFYIALIFYLSAHILANKYKNKLRGWIGEALVTRKLTKFCEIHGGQVLTDITLNYKGGTTQIDHILITTKGILVVETKNFSGLISGLEHWRNWNQKIRGKNYRFLNPIFQNKRHINAVRAVLDFIPEKKIQGVVAFGGDCEFKKGLPDGVIRKRGLNDFLDEFNFGLLSDDEVKSSATRLESKRYIANAQTDFEHQEYLERKNGKDNDYGSLQKNNSKNKGNSRQQKQVNKSKGKTGESTVSDVLTSYCLEHPFRVLNQVTLDCKDGNTRIDHILLTTRGILVIQTNPYTGWIFGRYNNKTWKQVIFRKKQEFQNPIMHNKKNISAVRTLLDFIPKEKIKGLVVFPKGARFKTKIPNGVIHINRLQSYLENFNYGLLSEDEISSCMNHLKNSRIVYNQETDFVHNNNLQ